MCKRKVIHLHGGTLGPGVNLGDALMLQETVRRIRQRFGPESQLSIRPEAGPYPDRAGLRLLQFLKSRSWRHPRQFISYPALRRYGFLFGVITGDEVAACLNFMGYRYFDVGRRETELDLRLTSALRKHGAPSILLPQAYGPFSTPRLRRHARQLFDLSALVYARDTRSADEVAALGCRRPEVVPDITIATPAGENPRPDLAGGVCLIPNRWMTERVAPPDARAYVASLVAVAKRVRRAGRSCFVLCHAPFQDQALAERIAGGGEDRIEIVREDDAPKAKALVGACRFVVGSRYHGLLAALSQNVPVLATTWAHKYPGLLDDYRCPEMLAYPSRPDDMAARLELLLSEAGWRRCAEPLPAVNAAARERIERMWTRVLSLVHDARPPAAGPPSG